MKMKRCFIWALAVCLLLVLTGCGSQEGAVYVQNVGELMGYGPIAPGDRFAGVVVSENVAEVEKDPDKTVASLMVKAGDDVLAGQKLFAYDTDELQLNLDKQKLELEQLNATIENYIEQIADLEEDREDAAESDQLQYTVQIQTLQVDLKEAELNRQAKEKEITQSEAILENAEVYSPVDGRIQAINENGTDNYGDPLPYITIQQSGSYRVKGILGELQAGVIMEGSPIKIVSRTDESQFWLGSVSLVDYENPSQGNNYDMYYGMPAEEMTSSSRYPFYVELESTEGLLLGQHVYLELDTGDQVSDGPALSSAFVCVDEDGSTYVWAEDAGGKLEKRTVTLGEYNMMTDSYPVMDGLTADDFIAFPDPELCVVGAPVTHEFVMEEEPAPEVEGELIAEGEVG